MQQKTYHPYSGSSLRLLVSALVALLSVAVGFAQNTGGSRTIDITSSFKPSLIPPKKIIPNATPAMVNGTRTVQPYDVPVQQLSFKYAPSPLKPLAFKDSAIADASKGYVKAGYGNFATPWLKAAINFGSGETVNGNLEGYYTSSQGKLPYQEFAKYGAKAHSIFQLNENHALDARVGYKGQNLYRYGFQPDTLKFSKEELKLNYNEAQLGATLGNRQGGEFGLYYKATLDGYFFSDNLNGNETALHYDLPLEKELGENVSFDIGIKGVVSNVKVPDTSFSNNVTILKAGVRMKIGEHSSIRAGLLPSWNNGEFKLLPQAEIEAFLPDKDLTFEAGVVGGYIENTWRSLTNFNPWIEQPDQLTHSRNLDIYAGLKANINENWFYKIKGGFQQRHNVPLYANDQEDGKTFNILWEPSLNIIRASGELVWSQGDKYSW
ncbi:MAG TPA: hypothetical protein VK907_05120 [Phnomibacter sp.]|nr:hypothetical protein [Phnomibacter sp.]